ncbi:hypothetical protein [Amycolatopsis pittospori]|uniref:hypothetical protein n=1 Tax=Amycolatopsis pittospori TaxID=2749434 RepID=UPI0015F01129|nr:hypothetical protein [Amycolatopsis pittospori]
MELAVIVVLAMVVGAGVTGLVLSRWHRRREAELVRLAQVCWEHAKLAEYVSAHRPLPRPGP